ncbi:hypothetical protein AB1Y20_006753 [Prymnesium parvum]|uniref:Uncharacterized protein n=1 Tax=Prymnesium parvum TaxID=97485 RepID=A0AB34J0K9_PRYPA
MAVESPLVEGDEEADDGEPYTTNGRRHSVDFSAESKENVMDDEAKKRRSSRISLSFLISGSAVGSTAAMSHVLAEEIIRRGTKLQPTRGRTIWEFFSSLTHLHLENQGLAGDVEPLKLCPRLRVLYLYDNNLTSLNGIENLKELTHLFAQNNEISDLGSFVAPASLVQLFLGGNCISVVDGLHTARSLRELRLSGQRVPNVINESAEEPGLRSPLSFELESLYTLANGLETLDLSNNRLRVSHIEPLVVLSGLMSLDLSRNELGLQDEPSPTSRSAEHKGGAEPEGNADEPSELSRMLHVISRLPNLTTLSLKENKLMGQPKVKERVILSCPVLEELDGKQIASNERKFLKGLVGRQMRPPSAPKRQPLRQAASAGVTRHVGPSRIPGRMLEQKERRAAGEASISRGVSIQSVANFEIPFPGLDGTVPQGLYSGEQGASAALPTAARRPHARTPVAQLTGL